MEESVFPVTNGLLDVLKQMNHLYQMNQLYNLTVQGALKKNQILLTMREPGMLET